MPNPPVPLCVMLMVQTFRQLTLNDCATINMVEAELNDMVWQDASTQKFAVVPAVDVAL